MSGTWFGRVLLMNGSLEQARQVSEFRNSRLGGAEEGLT